jgi:hypothetical protein
MMFAPEINWCQNAKQLSDIFPHRLFALFVKFSLSLSFSAAAAAAPHFNNSSRVASREKCVCLRCKRSPRDFQIANRKTLWQTIKSAHICARERRETHDECGMHHKMSLTGSLS